MKKAFFITGTDTNIGKTYSTVALLNYFNQKNLKTAAMKPVASGSAWTTEGLRNEDALQLQNAMSMRFSYEAINPLAFELPISPHLACGSQSLTIHTTLTACQEILNSDYNILLIEGCGGWMAPMNPQETFADLAAAFGFPIILIVGLRLGCLNHTLLTWENIQSRRLPFAGWIVNYIDPQMQKPEENIATLERMMGTPPLGIIPYQGDLTNLTITSKISPISLKAY